MADTNLNISVKLNDQATGTINKLNGTFQGFFNRTSAGWVALASKVYLAKSAITAIASGLNAFTSAAERQEDSIMRLKNALEIQGTMSDSVLRKYVRFSEEMQRATRYDNDAILELM